MFTKGQLLEIDITDQAEGHKCFGRMPDGLAVFVEGLAAVGDRVTASIFKIKKNYLEARLVSVLTPSAARVQPACTHFGSCGGCKWQHLSYPEQLRIKRKMVADALVHIGGFADVRVDEAIGSPRPYAYRNKVEFSFGRKRYLLPDEMKSDAATFRKPVDFAVGFHAPGMFDKVVDVDQCHIATDEMNTVLRVSKAFAVERGIAAYNTDTGEGLLRHLVVRHAHFTKQLMVNVVTSRHEPDLMAALLGRLQEALGDKLTTFINGLTARRSDVAYSDDQVVMLGRGIIVEQLGRWHFDISPNSFFQTNSEQALCLYETTRKAAGLSGREVVYDLYCGTGSIGIFVSVACSRVVGFEQEVSSVRDATANAKANGVSNAEFVQVDLKHFDAAREGRPLPDVVITDPPRAGMHADTVKALLRVNPRRIVYVSCNPASLARDAKLLCESGAYRLEEVQPVDLFPHTYHIESVARLERVDG